MFRTLGWPEALIVLSVVLIVFGVGKLPQVGGAMGRGIREFRRGQAGLTDKSDEEKSTKRSKKDSKKLSASSTENELDRG